jgi:tetratricopeptide (TPR) repeat protein
MKRAACLVFCAWLLGAQEPARVVFDRAAKALAAEDYQAAERGFQTVLRQEPRNIAALSNLGVIYSRTSRADEAIAVYQRALKLSPDDQAILLNLGLVYLRLENHARALPLFERVVAIDPNQLQARQLLAVCRAYSGQLAPAIRDLEALRAAAPRDENILFLLGFVYLKSHETDKAKAVFEQMFEVAGAVRAEFLLGRAYYESTQFAQAEERFLHVIELAPDFPGVHLELGKVYISLRRTDDAIHEFEHVLRQNTDDADAHYFLGGVLVQAGRFTEGVPHLMRAKAAKPDFWAPYFYLGKAELRLEHPADAVPLLQKAVKLNPDDASVYYLLGQSLEACGRASEAREVLRRVNELRAASLEPANADTKVAGAR